MLKPYALLGIGLMWLASLVGVGYWQHGAGRDAEKVASQKQFDDINKKLAEQKATANSEYRAAQADIIALQAERDKLKTDLAKEKQVHDKKTSDLRAYYAGIGLRFRAEGDGGCRGGSQRAEGATPHTAGAETTTIVQLPDAITRNLRQLALEADQLADDYRLCYGYATKVK